MEERFSRILHDFSIYIFLQHLDKWVLHFLFLQRQTTCQEKDLCKRRKQQRVQQNSTQSYVRGSIEKQGGNILIVCISIHSTNILCFFFTTNVFDKTVPHE